MICFLKVILYDISSHLHKQIIFRHRIVIFSFIFQETKPAEWCSITTDDFKECTLEFNFLKKLEFDLKE